MYVFETHNPRLLKIIEWSLGLFIPKDFIKNYSLINAEAKPRHSDINGQLQYSFYSSFINFLRPLLILNLNIQTK